MTQAVRVTWWGHSTVWLEDSGVRLLTDPLLTDRLAHLRRAAGPTPVLPGTPDAVLLSHLHADHLHLASLRRLGGDPLFVVPPGAGGFLRSGLRRTGLRLVELAPGQETSIGTVRVRAVPAAHPGDRGPWSRRHATPIGFVVEGGRRTWYAGDTGLFPEMAELGPLDLALIPVGGWGPSLGEGHLDPAGAAEAVRRARAAVSVPVHYGTFWPIGCGRLRPDLFHSPGTTFARLAAPVTDVRLLTHGETTAVGPA